MPKIRKAVILSLRVLLSDFDYRLPKDRIAQRPLDERSASRMLVVDRQRSLWLDRAFTDLPEHLRPGDCLVVNQSKVFPSRLLGHRAGFRGSVEVFLLAPASADRMTWRALVRPGKKVRSRERIQFEPGFEAEILGRGERGERLVRLHAESDLDERIERAGHVPLPPYIRRPDTGDDRSRYQTIFAKHTGSVAAPTAGLHFTPEVVERCRAAGAGVARVTLSVGLGTFQPLDSETVEGNRLHGEPYAVSDEDAGLIKEARRVVAVGTTSVRVIETLAAGASRSGETALFIYPGFEFRSTGALLTNFHLPRSSLLLLVCAFAGRELTLAAYRHAVEAGYRFYSYGDCMLIV